MANIRFFRNSQNEALTENGATLKNGSGGGAPAEASDSAYPMSNALLADRYSPWRTNNTPAGTPVNLDVDLGGTLSIYAIGVHGFTLISGSMGTLTLGYQTGTYNGAGSFTTFGTISAASLTTSRDRAVVDTGTQSARSLRWSFAHTSAIWSVGKVFAVVAPTIDCDALMPGSLYTPVRYQTENVGPSGIPAITDHNRDGFLWSLDLGPVSSALRLAVWTIVNSASPVSMIDDADKLEEVRIPGGQIPSPRAFSTYNPRLDLTRLP